MAGTLNKVMAWLGLAEEPYDDYDDLPEEEQPVAVPRRERPAPVESPGRAERSNVRTIAPARSAPRPDPVTERFEPAHNVRPVPSSKVHVTNPTTFNDVEEVGVNFRNGVPTIMNLAGASESVAKRLLDFASGLIFGLDGRIERVGDRVFLLTPVGVDVSTEERRRLSERGFFNQA
jgi:cell division inhibitor SepF